MLFPTTDTPDVASSKDNLSTEPRPLGSISLVSNNRLPPSSKPILSFLPSIKINLEPDSGGNSNSDSLPSALKKLTPLSLVKDRFFRDCFF